MMVTVIILSIGRRAPLTEATDELLSHRNGPLTIAGHQPYAGAPIQNVGDIHGALVGDRVFELGPGDVDPLGYRLERPVAGGSGDDVRRPGAAPLHQPPRAAR